MGGELERRNTRTTRERDTKDQARGHEGPGGQGHRDTETEGGGDPQPNPNTYMEATTKITQLTT